MNKIPLFVWLSFMVCWFLAINADIKTYDNYIVRVIDCYSLSITGDSDPAVDTHLEAKKIRDTSIRLAINDLVSIPLWFLFILIPLVISLSKAGNTKRIIKDTRMALATCYCISVLLLMLYYWQFILPFTENDSLRSIFTNEFLVYTQAALLIALYSVWWISSSLDNKDKQTKDRTDASVSKNVT